MFDKRQDKVGIGITQGGLYAARYKWNSGWRLSCSMFEPLSFRFFDEGMQEGMNRGLFIQAIKNTMVDVVKNDVVSVTISDPLTSFFTYSLNNIPKKRSDQLRLCQAHFMKQDNANTMQLSFQDLGIKNGQHLMVGLGIEKVWFNWLQEAFLESGLRVSGFTAHSCASFNHLYEELVAGGCMAAMIAIYEDSWSLLIWDKDGCLKFWRPVWRGKMPRKEEYQLIIDDVERISMSYAGGEESKAVSKIYVVGYASDAKEVFDLLKDNLDKTSMASLKNKVAAKNNLFFLGGKVANLAFAAALGFET